MTSYTHADPAADAAFGSLLGAAVGDAAGAVLEFIGRMPSQDEVEAALRMPGGGVWEVGPGQVTDDTEMAMCLGHALADHPASGPVPLDHIATWYGKWLNSPPFDIGNTTRAALSAVRDHPKSEGLGARMQQVAAESNQESLSNGCLMRIMPMAIWSCRRGVEGVAANAATDTSLTHPQKTAQVASGSYCIAIAHLINNPKDAAGAISAVQQWLKQGLEAALEHCQAQQVAGAGSQSRGPSSNGGSRDPSSNGSTNSSCSGSREHAYNPGAEKCRMSKPWQTVLEWLGEAEEEGPGPDVHMIAGYMKWAYVHAFRALSMHLPFEESLRQVLLLGGDTDTNAAIVGGLMGAYWGAGGIPEYMTGPVLSRCSSGGSPGIKRPGFLQTGQLPAMFEKLWESAGR